MRLAFTLAIFAIVPSGLMAQGAPTTEDAVKRALSRIDELELYMCDHGVESGSTFVAYQMDPGASASTALVEGFGNWSGAEVQNTGTEIISLRLAHDFVLMQKLTDGQDVRMTMRGVVGGNAVEGFCESVKPEMLSLMVNLLAPE